MEQRNADLVTEVLPSQEKRWQKYYSEKALNLQLPEQSIYDYMKSCNLYHQDTAYALNYFGTRITFRELFRRVDECGKALMQQGVKPGDVVTVVTLSCIDSTVAFYAINHIGAVADYINVMSRPEDFAKFFEESDSHVVVTMDLFAGGVLKAAHETDIEKVIVYSITDDMPAPVKEGYLQSAPAADLSWMEDPLVLPWEEFLRQGAHCHKTFPVKDPHTAAVFGHTGGTTGFPKAVLLDDYACNAISASYRASIVVKTDNDRSLNCLVPFYVYGLVVCLHMTLCYGGCSILLPKFEPDKWYEYFTQYQPNLIAAVPAYVAPIAYDERLKDLDLSELHFVGVGGDGCTDQLEEDLNAFLAAHGSSAKLIKGYGMTEVAAGAMTCWNNCNKIGSVGIPHPMNNVMIYDNDAEEEVGYNTVGEICLDCATRMMGYKDNEEATRDIFREHDGVEWLHTGDLGYLDEDGMLYLVGRIKRIIMAWYGGSAHKVFPSMPEEVIATHPAVQDVCVVKMTADERIRLKAFVSLKNDERASYTKVEEALKELCTNKLADFQRPYAYEFRKDLPHTPAGKVDYRKLEKEA